MREDNFDNDLDTEDSEDVEIYTLTDEDGNETEFELLGRHDENGQSYVALVPVEEEDDDEEEGSFIILKVVEQDGEEIFETIEDDDEFDRIADIFEDELMQDVYYDEENESDEPISEEDE
jgi:uncharacterized protein YrzB (UPF0473 family)